MFARLVSMDVHLAELFKVSLTRYEMTKGLVVGFIGVMITARKGVDHIQPF